jgi:hypothetical protein
MMICMRRLLPLLVLAALALPLAAFAADAPPPAAVAACQQEAATLGKDAFVAKYGPTEPFGHCYAAQTATTTTDDPAAAACKAEYVKLGPDAFKAKYGATEPFGNCLAAHKQQPTTTPTPSTDDPATAACKAEYVKLGPDAFKAKYGATEPFGNCLAAQRQTKPTTAPPKPTGDDGSKGLAQALCYAEGKALGKDAFLAKYGKEALGACVKATLAKAREIVASCKASSGSSKDAFKACLAAAAPPKRR